MQWRIQGRGPPPLFLDQTEARRAETIFLRDHPSPPYLRVWMTGPPPPLSQDLDPALKCIVINDVQKCEQDECLDSAAP